jgi:hypothetical protein
MIPINDNIYLDLIKISDALRLAEIANDAEI